MAEKDTAEVARLRELLRSARSALKAARPIIVAAARIKEAEAKRLSIVGAASTLAWIDAALPAIEQELDRP
jgi:hypothetical protein